MPRSIKKKKKRTHTHNYACGHKKKQVDISEKEIIGEPSPNIDKNLNKEFLLKTPPRYLSPSQIKLRAKYKRQSIYVPKHKQIIQKISSHENKLLLCLP